MVNKKIFGIMLVLLVVAPLVTAFGVTTEYWDEKPLEMYPGQTKEINLLLQNMVGSKDMILSGKITQGEEIAILTDKNTDYLVPFGTKNNEVNIKLTIPEDYKIGDRHEILLAFKQIAEGDGRMLELSGSVISKVPVEIKSMEEVSPEELQKSQSSGTSIVLVLVIIGLVTLLVTIKRKKINK